MSDSLGTGTSTYDQLSELNSLTIEACSLGGYVNAVDSMEAAQFRNGNVIELVTELTATGDVRIAVVDSGIGVASSVAKDLFRHFSTNKSSGGGLGLSLGRSIAIVCGGQIDYFNNPSTGATFFLTLPPALGESE